MSRIFKSQQVNIDENNRVKIKSLQDVPTQNVGTQIQNDNLDISIETPPEKYETIELEDANETSERIKKKAKLEADNIILKAREDASNIIEDAKEDAYKEAVSIKDEAYKTGYDDGVKNANKIADSIKEESESIKKEALRYKEDLINKIEPDMIELIIDILDKLLWSEVNINPKVISTLIKQGLSDTTLTDNVSVRVSKEDYDFVLSSKEDIISLIGTAAVDFVEDARLEKSDCIIETEFGSIDCSLNSQYEELKKNLYYILKNR